MKVGDLVRHVNEGWKGIIIEIKSDPNVTSKWLEIYCAENSYIFGRWSTQVEKI